MMVEIKAKDGGMMDIQQMRDELKDTDRFKEFFQILIDSLTDDEVIEIINEMANFVKDNPVPVPEFSDKHYQATLYRDFLNETYRDSVPIFNILFGILCNKERIVVIGDPDSPQIEMVRYNGKLTMTIPKF